MNHSNDQTESQPIAITKVSLEQLAIDVSAAENRPVSFTNKRSGYYHTQTHANNHPEHAWFSGYNLAQKRLFSDYQIRLDSELLNRQQASVSVYPDKLVRRYPDNTIETLMLFDNQDIVRIGLSSGPSKATLTLTGEQIHKQGSDGELSLYQSSEDPEKVIAVAPIIRTKDIGNNQEQGFYVLIADDLSEANALLSKVREHDATWQQQRQQRMLKLINSLTSFDSSDGNLTKAIAWQILNLDSLMTNQHGKGIYAGLPWFNEYWGRDSFISLPGATLVTGQFEFARDMITAFAKFQDRDPDSKFFGRVPNRVRIEDIDYHTTDGTPRFVIEMLHYVQYSGDASLIEQLYPNVKDSINGSLKNWVDNQGYLLHADNETWMDARREPDKVPYSPRGSRANDIQALWFKQLQAGIYFASVVGDQASLASWQQALAKLQANFRKDFVLTEQDMLADHLNTDNSADMQLRPNQLYAFDMVRDNEFTTRATRKAWQQLVYPWGVASLDNRDPNFHPYHLTDAYHKDSAYHNGTVWLWNNGIAMQRMIEAGDTELAYQLFENMNAQALTRGVVGGLAENADAYPVPGQTHAKITGTYLQAWSNAEQLRVWYQYFLGIRPDLIKQEITFAPRIPKTLSDVKFQIKLGQGQLQAVYKNQGLGSTYRVATENFAGVMVLDIPPYSLTRINIEPGIELRITDINSQLIIDSVASNKETAEQVVLTPEQQRLTQQQMQQRIMSDTVFASPLPLTQHQTVK
ncbi:amylo-alpha-1,6-glucosidase [Thalassotalea mangrovi]|uniref:Glycogen debranching enzyme C-terminal domain-containing protein n=1 Tax=Thalassotalea mangrovi TaxID=2572245 RepID=A0A4U1B753_9GAMM|nr:amylo-alpha-1,6-glucosidase [Thalassotalea mangrovi]TKB46270.1 hypothetical protein E8M12_04250 [Thalassotalea mangrovi]